MKYIREKLEKACLATQFHPVFAGLTDATCCLIDLSEKNAKISTAQNFDTEYLHGVVFNEIVQNNKKFGVGGYGESREMYSRSAHFGTESRRTEHLGVDIWCETGSQVYAPLQGKIHSAAFNDGYGNYGGTVIVEHELHGVPFFSLYGHVAIESVNNCTKGKMLEKGEPFCNLGNEKENGHWPPHLHFQLILDMGKHQGDYPGVSHISEKRQFLNNCPDPNLILKLCCLL